jgi:hypothetical protein
MLSAERAAQRERYELEEPQGCFAAAACGND